MEKIYDPAYGKYEKHMCYLDIQIREYSGGISTINFPTEARLTVCFENKVLDFTGFNLMVSQKDLTNASPVDRMKKAVELVGCMSEEELLGHRTPEGFEMFNCKFKLSKVSDRVKISDFVRARL